MGLVGRLAVDQVAGRGPVGGEVVAPLDLAGPRRELEGAKEDDDHGEEGQDGHLHPRLGEEPQAKHVRRHGGTVALRAMRWRPALATIAALFLISRGALVLVALLLENSIPLSYHGPTFSTEPLLRSLTGSDSVYLLGIAADGYHAAPVQAAFRDWVFFPLYPLVTRAASVLT